jgi:transcriptional regulator with GAF, ATPase, and Fis domain
MGEYQSEMYDVCGGAEKERDLNETLNTLVKTITEVMRVKGASIRLLDERTNSLNVAAAYGLSRSYVNKGPLPVSEHSVESEILGGKIVSTVDVTREAGAVFREEAEREGIKSILNVPLMAGDRAIGIVRVYTGEPHEFGAEEKERLISLASFGGVIVDRARLSDQMRALVCIAQSISSTLSLDEVLQMITENATQALAMKASSIRLIDIDRKTLEVKAASGLSADYLAKGPVEIGKSPIDRECMAGKCIIVPDISRDERLQYPEEILREGIQGMLTVPLKVKGRSIGVLRVYSSTPYAFNASEIEFLTALASFGAIAIENARLFEHVKSEYEELTKDVWKWYDWGSRFPNI